MKRWNRPLVSLDVFLFIDIVNTGDPERQNEILPLLRKYGGVAVVRGETAKETDLVQKGIEYVRYNYL